MFAPYGVNELFFTSSLCFLASVLSSPEKVNVSVPPTYFRTLLNIQLKLLNLGSGGLMSTAKYQEGANLNKCVKTLQKIDIEFKIREKKEDNHNKGNTVAW